MEEFNFASVMIIIHFTNAEPYVILIKRTQQVRNHAGEISFPGGKFVDFDMNMLETALREIHEELDIRVKRNQVIGHLNEERTLTSRYIIYPYVTLLSKMPKIINTNYEVEKIIDTPLIPLLKTRTKDLKHQDEYSISELPKFKYKGEIIWGATARILDQIEKIFFCKIEFR